MKYLKVYNLFESNELDIPDHIKQEINDISYDITDEGYIVSWFNNTINITKGNKSAYSDIKELCDRIIDYLDLEGYQGLVKFKGIGSDDNFYPIDRSLVTWGPFKDYHMCVSRYYKIEVHKKEDINESNSEDVINYCKDLLLEIKDIGFDVNIHPGKDRIDIKIKKNLTDSEFDEEFNTPEFKVINMGSFRLSLIKDSVLSVVSYLTESGYDLESIFCYGGDFNKDDRNSGDMMELNDFERLSSDTFLSTLMIDFRKPKKYACVNEVKYYLDLSESIKVLHDICYELKDEDLEYYIQPDNEVKVRMLSLVLNDKIEPRKLDFHLEIDTTGKLVKRSGMFSAPDWFIEILKRVEDYVSTLGFSVKCLIFHPYRWRSLNSIEELSQVSGIVRAVKLQFKSEKILENRNH